MGWVGRLVRMWECKCFRYDLIMFLLNPVAPECHIPLVVEKSAGDKTKKLVEQEEGEQRENSNRRGRKTRQERGAG